MFSAGKQLVALASLPIAVAAIAIPATSYAAEMSSDAPVISAPSFPAAPILIDADMAAPTFGRDATYAAAARPTDNDEVDAELECMAKVVLHEAGNQSRRGQLAVAQLMMNRLESGRFAETICGVANQPGQFFQTASYNPRRDSDGWRAAVQVARDAREGVTDDVAPGALFFRAAYASAGNFFRSRQRVTTLGDHIFYR